MTKQQYSDYQAAVERGLRGLEAVSTGACPGCEECGLSHEWRITAPDSAPPELKSTLRLADTGPFDSEDEARAALAELRADPDCAGVDCDPCVIVDTAEDDHRRELAEEPSFSWSACDCCGSSLGGDRHPAHGWLKREGSPDLLVHLNVCSDCLYFINYGELDDLTMMEMAEGE